MEQELGFKIFKRFINWPISVFIDLLKSNRT